VPCAEDFRWRGGDPGCWGEPNLKPSRGIVQFGAHFSWAIWERKASFPERLAMRWCGRKPPRPMSRRLASFSLLCAWLCASGAMLDVAQVFAWGRMFTGYARSESLIAAARETFDPGKPCEICRAVSKAREASGKHAPAVPSAGTEKMVMIFERMAPTLMPPIERSWPTAPGARVLVQGGDVPVPPPRPLPA